jgi:hypothetical protein
MSTGLVAVVVICLVVAFVAQRNEQQKLGEYGDSFFGSLIKFIGMLLFLGMVALGVSTCAGLFG